MCHVLLQDPNFFHLLLRIDEELAREARAGGCACGGVLHRANYPRKPRGCPSAVRSDFAARLSFCCAACRKRTTSRSVRFLGRRVYLALAVVLGSARHAGQNPAAARLAGTLAVPVRTLQRWRAWWREQFPRTALWQARGAHFLPPVAIERCPASLLERFAGDAAPQLLRLLVFLTPLTVAAVTLHGGR
ncbi:MAG: hypothetical protein KGZ68_18005 [Dechloromonas sp.]|uniref:hypothetical protein n=1 Tax=Dechloromonas sp. CZR5 TaxID=2608630 RepID=UPI00123E108A|nr:hypothetical protein [Dechloromonas sp. CZR5]MBS4020122.1 hypothetical protein [Dechloromonas sp.]